MTEEEKKQKQYALVVKSNELIRKSRFSLSLVEQKIVLYIISKIKQEDTELLEYTLDVREFCDICGIEYRPNLSQLKQTLLEMGRITIEYNSPKTGWTFIRWLEKVYLYENTGILNVRLDKDMMPFLINLKKNFTAYNLIAILAMKSKFSVRLYELFKSYEFLMEYKVSLEELRELLLLKKEYPKIYDFKRYVIDKSIEEINEYTDLEVSYEVVKSGKTITGFIFSIKKYEGFDGEYHAASLFLEGKLPSRNKREEHFKRFIKNYKSLIENETPAAAEIDPNQFSLFEEQDNTAKESDSMNGN